jgi:outer membrane protein W
MHRTLLATTFASILALMQDTPVRNPFAEGNWVWTFYAGGAFGDEAGEVYLAHIGAGYHFVDNLSINIEGLVAFADADESFMSMGATTENSGGGGFNLLFRWHFWNESNFSMYLDGGCGMIVFSDEFPAHGTNHNFTPQAGVGFTFDLNDDAMLMAGARWYHISNARHSGKDNNPGFDAALIYAGVMWPF